MSPRRPKQKPQRAPSRWREATVDTSGEHFALGHEAARSCTVALVGLEEMGWLTVSFTLEGLPAGVDASLIRKHVEAELDFWCRPNPDDAWYLIDLWYLLGQHAGSAANERARVKWSKVRSQEQGEPVFVHEVTRLAREWMRQAWRGRDRSDPSAVTEARSQVQFVCDYVSVMAVDDNPQGMTLGRLKRLVRLQAGENAAARFELSLFGEDFEDIRVRVERFADLDFVDAHAVSDYFGFVVSKLPKRGGPPPEAWSRGEVRKLLHHVAEDFEVHGDTVDLMADAEGPHVMVRFDGGGSD